MEYFSSATKRLLFGDAESTRGRITHEIGQTLFPFLYPPQEVAKNDFSRKDDYLFLPNHLCAKQLFHFETGSLLLIGGAFTLLCLLVLATFFSTSILVIATAVISIFYFIFMVFKLWVVRRSLSFGMTDFAPEEIAQLRDDELPLYTVLVPLLHEAEVAHQIVSALTKLDYPEDKLNFIITLEQHDTETYEALMQAGMPASWKICWLPDTKPKAKPKSLNVAFLETYGEHLVIYDAEILPDHDQLKKAVLAFREQPNIAVFQTRLDHYNTDQNIITKLFNTEFTFHYDMFLPGLQSLNVPIPLSGHSVHYRTEALVRAGAWDPYNVAEDCELGVRLHRAGYRTGIINSISREEAASDVWGWVKQRTRWMKGFIQTSIVHLRYPLHLKEELGSWKDFVAFCMLVPGTVLLNVLNFFSWFVLLAWFVTGAEAIRDMYPMIVLYIANIAALAGGFIFMYLNLVALYRRNNFHLVKYFFLTPVYWFLLAFATARAFWQLRSYESTHTWEKTTHGTHLVRAKAQT